jgi:hypothetical protein
MVAIIPEPGSRTEQKYPLSVRIALAVGLAITGWAVVLAPFI